MLKKTPLLALALLGAAATVSHAALIDELPQKENWCSGGVSSCFDGDEQLFDELIEVLRNEPENDNSQELVMNLIPLLSSPAIDVRGKPVQVVYNYRMAHGETANWLNYQSKRLPHAKDLANRVQQRGAYKVGVYENHQHFPDCLNRELFNFRPENAQPFAPRGVWPYLDDFMEILEKNVGSFREELFRANGQDLLHGSKLTEHEHGIQEGEGKWFMTRPLMGYECEDPSVYTFSCKLFRQIEKRWFEKFGVKHRIYEAKYLVLHPNVWIRPHTADSNQQMKIHLCLDNPGMHATMYSCNSTNNWQPGKARLFDDSFLHDVKSTAPKGTPPRIVLDIKMDHPDSRAVPLYGDGTMLMVRDAAGNAQLSNVIWSQIVVQLDGDAGRDANTAFGELANRGTQEKPFDPCPWLPAVGEAGYAELDATVEIYSRTVIFSEPRPEPISRCFTEALRLMRSVMPGSRHHEVEEMDARHGDSSGGGEEEEERRGDEDEGEGEAEREEL